jgi:hypothetical protein
MISIFILHQALRQRAEKAIRGRVIVTDREYQRSGRFERTIARMPALNAGGSAFHAQITSSRSVGKLWDKLFACAS